MRRRNWRWRALAALIGTALLMVGWPALDAVAAGGPSVSSGDTFDAKSGFGLWANEMPEAGQGPAVGEVTIQNLRMSDNAVDVRNTTSTFRINQLP
ncbi:hypothetical protein J7F03_25250 [Streptomyces sp. ISL-43]|uniref:hypothetical protein n=1 Tax=Streptomyces sp. ISL-43 TaxID=2819183 RepID=UPI001BE68346|nr:hypothetical protein [Streptomyces sp. ISL-43]MBT2450323.1 hypothetical protein [Streptomyces sp. ISL-43]